jgi:hypothetical protein
MVGKAGSRHIGQMTQLAGDFCPAAGETDDVAAERSVPARYAMALSDLDARPEWSAIPTGMAVTPTAGRRLGLDCGDHTRGLAVPTVDCRAAGTSQAAVG